MIHLPEAAGKEINFLRETCFRMSRLIDFRAAPVSLRIRAANPAVQTFSPDLLLRAPQHSHDVLLRLAGVTAEA
jgi:hypothetical protein